MNRDQIQPGMRVQIRKGRGKQAKSYTGTVMEYRPGHVFWVNHFPVLRDGMQIPQLINCERLTLLDPNDDHLFLGRRLESESRNSPGEQSEHHVDYERHGQKTHQEVQSNPEGSQS